MIALYSYTGAGTQHGPLAQVTLLSADTEADPTLYPVARGSQSYERWLKVKTTGETASRFYVLVKSLPAGVTLKMGASDAYQTPTNASSTIATKTMAVGERYIWHTLAGTETRYCVLQMIVDTSASPGAILGAEIEVGWLVGD